MNGFIAELPNKPGVLATLTEVIAHKGINITGFCGVALGRSGVLCLLTNDEVGTRKALAEAHYRVREIELVAVSLADTPGTLAEAARRLGNAGVNIMAAFPTGRSGATITLAFATDDPAKARAALGERALAGSTP